MSLVIGDMVTGWVARRTNEYGDFSASQAIGWERRGELVAGVVYAQWNGPNVVCHIASDGSKRWLTREYLWTIFDYPFNQMSVKRITVCIGEGNTDSRRFVRNLGFEEEAIHPEAHLTGALITYRMWRNNCRFLRAPYAEFSRPDLLRAAA